MRWIGGALLSLIAGAAGAAAAVMLLFGDWGSLPQPVRASYANVLHKAIPAVVTLRVTATKQTPKEIQPRASASSPSRIEAPASETYRTGGSGVIVNAASGHILTNNHVIEQATSIDVGLSDGRHFDARIIGKDPGTDLAVLKIDASSLPQIATGDSCQK